MDVLPPEVLIRCFTFLPEYELAYTIQLVSRGFRRAGADNALWLKVALERGVSRGCERMLGVPGPVLEASWRSVVQHGMQGSAVGYSVRKDVRTKELQFLRDKKQSIWFLTFLTASCILSMLFLPPPQCPDIIVVYNHPAPWMIAFLTTIIFMRISVNLPSKTRSSLPTWPSTYSTFTGSIEVICQLSTESVIYNSFAPYASMMVVWIIRWVIGNVVPFALQLVVAVGVSRALLVRMDAGVPKVHWLMLTMLCLPASSLVIRLCRYTQIPHVIELVTDSVQGYLDAGNQFWDAVGVLMTSVSTGFITQPPTPSLRTLFRLVCSTLLPDQRLFFCFLELFFFFVQWVRLSSFPVPVHVCPSRASWHYHGSQCSCPSLQVVCTQFKPA